MSTPEYLDWLDAKGKIIGSVERKLAHTYGLYHPVVHVWILDGKNNLLIQQRTKNMIVYPLHWDSSAAGHFDSGETKEKGAMRELKEELGLQTKLNYIGHCDVEHQIKNAHHKERIHYFWGRSTTIPRLQKSEVKGFTRVPLPKMNAFIRQHTMTHTFMGGWKKFGKKLERITK